MLCRAAAAFIPVVFGKLTVDHFSLLEKTRTEFETLQSANQTFKLSSIARRPQFQFSTIGKTCALVGGFEQPANDRSKQTSAGMKSNEPDVYVPLRPPKCRCIDKSVRRLCSPWKY